MVTSPAGAPRRARRETKILSAILVAGIVASVLSSFFTTYGTPVLLGALALAVLFLPQFQELLIILFPVGLLNPQLRLGTGGMVVSEARSFHPINVNMTEILIGGILLSWLLRGRNRVGERAGRPLNFPVFGLLLLSLVGILVAVKKSSAIVIGVEKMIEPLVLFFVITHIRWDRRQLQRAAGVLVACSAVVALRSIWLWNISPPEPVVEQAPGVVLSASERLRSYWAATNVVGAFLTMIAPLAFLLTFYARTARGRLGAGLAFGAMMVGVALVQTRTLWGATGLVLLILAMRFRRGWFLIGAAAVTMALFGTDLMFQRGRSMLNPAQDVSFLNRVVVWRDSLEILLGSPLYGIGFGSFLRVYRSPLTNYHSHNDLLFLGVEMGVLAPLLFIVLVARVVMSLRRAARWVSDRADRVMLAGFGGGLAAAGLASLMECNLSWPSFSLAFWYTLGLAAAYARTVTMDQEDRAVPLPNEASGRRAAISPVTPAE